MPLDVSHFSMVGFALDTVDKTEFVRQSGKLVSICHPTALTATDLTCLVKDKSGAELHIGLERSANGVAQIATMNPAYAGEGRASLDIAKDVSDPDSAPFETTISAHFSGEATPVFFELADPSAARAAVAGKHVVADIAAFSFAPQLYDNDAAFAAAQAKSGAKISFTSDYFVPSGMFFKHAGGALPDGATRPIAYGDFAGQILSCELKTNATGGGHFWWALVKTHAGAMIDVVMDPATVKSNPKVGQILTGRFWLTARLLPAASK